MNLVWFSETRWDYMRLRKQHILSELAKRHNILFIEPYTLGHNRPFSFRRTGPVSVYTLPTIRPSPFRWLNFLMKTPLAWLYYILMYPVLFARLGEVLRGSRIICSNVYFIPMVKWFARSYYWDFNDDPEQFGPLPRWSSKSLHRFLRRADGVFVPSMLYEKRLTRLTNRPVHYLPNGIETAGFQIQSPAERNGVCYLGAILDWSFDSDLVKYLARRLPKGSIHVYGHVTRTMQAEINELTTRHGIIYHGTLDYNDIPSTLMTYQVGIVPLKDKPEIRRAASSKVLQYLAAGLMVVSRPMLEYENFSPCIQFKVRKQEFAEAVISYLSNPVYDDQLHEKLSERDWKNLAAKIEQIIA